MSIPFPTSLDHPPTFVAHVIEPELSIFVINVSVLPELTRVVAP